MASELATGLALLASNAPDAMQELEALWQKCLEKHTTSRSKAGQQLTGLSASRNNTARFRPDSKSKPLSSSATISGSSSASSSKAPKAEAVSKPSQAHPTKKRRQEAPAETESAEESSVDTSESSGQSDDQEEEEARQKKRKVPSTARKGRLQKIRKNLAKR